LVHDGRLLIRTRGLISGSSPLFQMRPSAPLQSRAPYHSFGWHRYSGGWLPEFDRSNDLGRYAHVHHPKSHTTVATFHRRSETPQSPYRLMPQRQ
jgi:hypothetical protein